MLCVRRVGRRDGRDLVDFESKPDVVLIGATGSSVSFQIIQTLVSSPLPPHVLLIGMEDERVPVFWSRCGPGRLATY